MKNRYQFGRTWKGQQRRAAAKRKVPLFDMFEGLLYSAHTVETRKDMMRARARIRRGII